MANAYSTFKARQGWIDPTNQDFTLKALMYTQQKYDANRAKVEGLVEQYKSLQLARDVDKNYLNEKLTSLVNSVNAQGGNYSSNAVTAAAVNQIGSVLDENVMTAMQQTAKIQNYYKEVAAIREKSPDKYNETNEAYGLRAAQEYLNNGELGAKIQGQLAYTNYVDVHGEMNKYLLEIQKGAKNGKIQVPVMTDELDGSGKPTGNKVRTGEMREVTVNGLSAQELRDVAINFVGNRFDNQLRINSWGSTGGFQNMEGIVESANARYDQLIAKRTKEKAELESQLTGKVSDAEKESIENKIVALNQDIINSTDMKKAFSTNPEAALMYIEKERMISSAANAMGLLRTESIEYKKDDYYFATIDKNLAIERLAFEKEQKEIDNRFKGRELELKEIELGIKAAKGDGDSSSSGTTIGGANGLVMHTEELAADAANQESAHNAWKSNISEQYNSMNSFGNNVINKIQAIANGSDPNSDKGKMVAAKALLNKMQASGVDLKNRTGKNIQTFMQELSRADAYDDLQFLPLEGNTNINVKNSYNALLRDWSVNATNYKKAKTGAIMAERSNGQGRNFEDNENFIQTASKYGNSLRFQNVASSVVNTKNKANFGRLIGLSEEAKANGGIAALEENTGVSIKDLKNGKVQVTYQTKVKNKETGVDELINQTVTVNKKTAENVLPELKAISGNNSKYTINTMGTKELYSPKIGFLQKGSNNFENFQEELSLYSSNPSFDSKLLDVNEAKKTAKQLVLNNGIKKNSELAQQLEQIVDLVFSPNVYNNIRTSVYYRNSANSDNGRGYIGVNSRTKGNLFNISLTNKHSLDEEVQLNEFLPQVIYSRAMIEKLTEMAVESQQAGKLVMSPELQKLINANG